MKEPRDQSFEPEYHLENAKLFPKNAFTRGNIFSFTCMEHKPWGIWARFLLRIFEILSGEKDLSSRCKEWRADLI
jgi:hypothetical protein